MLPKPRQDLKPNTAEFERLPFVKATGFREYDARWRYPEEINLLGLEAVGAALATLMRARGVKQRIVVGHDFRSYSARDQGGGDDRPPGRRRRGARYRPGAVADGLFRPVRARRRRRRHGHREPQRQWLDRHQDGHAAAAHLRPRRHDRAEGDRARGALRDAWRRQAISSCRTCPSATWRRCLPGRN